MRKNLILQSLPVIFFHLFFILGFSTVAPAERLSFKTYTTADGLAHDNINKIVRDSRGFLWFCTAEGLSRFDGYGFKNFTQQEGLPHRNINEFLETKDGTYIAGTSNGLAVFNPNGRAYRWDILAGQMIVNGSEPPMFRNYFFNDATNKNAENVIEALAQTENGDIFVGTNHGLYRFVKPGGEWQFQKVEFADWPKQGVQFNALHADAHHGLWIVTSYAVYWMSADGQIEKLHEMGGNQVFEDRGGRVWVDTGGHDFGIRTFTFQNEHPQLLASYTKKDGLPKGNFTNAFVETIDGKIYVNSQGILCEFLPEAKENEPKFRRLEIDDVTTGIIDSGGNLWLGINGKGASKLPVNSFVTFDKRDGLPSESISSLFLGLDDHVYLTAGTNKLLRFADGRLETVIPKGVVVRTWGTTFLDFQARDGEWWIPSFYGLLRYPQVKNFSDLARIMPKRVYSKTDGLVGDVIFNQFEDSRGDIWLSTNGQIDSLYRWERKTDKIISYTDVDALPQNNGVISFGEDPSGNMWFGFFYGTLARYRDGKFQLFTAKDGIPEGYISNFLSDKQGRFWLTTTSRGLFQVIDPNADQPTFKNYSTASGLSSNQTLCLTEDNFGRIYVGTGRGINRFDANLENITVYTLADGLPANLIAKCGRDKQGVLWFATTNELVKFVPGIEKMPPPPAVFIDRMLINGVEQKISALGENNVEVPELNSDQKQIQFDFFALGFVSGDTLRYQYKLNDQDWSAPTEQRSVDFNLASGDYKLAVRAVRANNLASETPAVVSFKIAKPIWQRGWFVLLVAFIIASLIFGLDRYRVAKTRQVQNALAQSTANENRFRTLAETASDAIITIDDQSTIVFANAAVEKVFGYRPDEIVGEKMMKLMPAGLQSSHETGLNRYLSSNTKSMSWEGIELTGQHRNGSEIPLELSFGEFERDGQRFFTGIARDISERKRNEEALRKAREERLAELQRVRTRIATDLHDDIGSSLTQIAVLSEVARGQASNLKLDNLKSPLERIKNVSRELVAVMSDVVWAINPNKDFLQDLVQRMRRFASDVFSGSGMKFEFQTPDVDSRLQLGANIRREVFAIFKESVNNAVKYSECTEARADFQIENEQLILTIEDNGKGFDTEKILSDDFKPEFGGNGLVNIRRRALDLGGSCEIESEIGHGTKITLRIPLQNP